MTMLHRSANSTMMQSGVTTRWVEQRFGTPAFVRTVDLGPAPAGCEGVTELVYRTRHAWVQVLADDAGAVVRFSITVTDPKFSFPVRDLTWDHLTVKLGRSRFADIRSQVEAEGRSLRVGAHNFEYSEAYYFGNPGNYQHYVLSYNDCGTGIFDTSVGSGAQWCQDGGLKFNATPRPGHPVFDPSASYLAVFRSRTVINTLTILGPWRNLADLTMPRGPDSNQVRVLLADARERRHRRRLARRWNRRVLREIKRQAHEPSSGEEGELETTRESF
jgi:hypothetical protein